MSRHDHARPETSHKTGDETSELTQRAWYAGTGVVVGGVLVIFFVLLNLVPVAVVMALVAVAAMVEVTRAIYRLDQLDAGW